jgi:hypothetical protein
MATERLKHVIRKRLLVAVILLVSSWLEAAAADPAMCRQYARGALVQVRGGLASPRCGAGLQGRRWSTDFAVHYEWCLETPPLDVTAEREARTKALKGCTDD